MIRLRSEVLLPLLAAATTFGCSSGSAGAPSADLAPPEVEAANVDSLDASSPDAVSPPSREEWRKSMARKPPAMEGCFMASHPNMTWVRVPCVEPPQQPMAPAPGPPHTPAQNVGGGVGDYMLGSPGGFAGGFLNWAEGSFPVTINPTPNSYYSFQLNTNFFDTTTCSFYGGSGLCQGWQQFVYDSGSNTIFMEYWLLDFGPDCPDGWNAASVDGHSNCWQTSSGATSVPHGNWNATFVTATAGANDSMVMFIGDGDLYARTQSSVLGLEGAWQQAEFNVFGENNGEELTFPGNNTTLQVQLVTSGYSAKPATYVQRSTTGESTNLNLIGAPCAFGGVVPGITFTESDVPGATAIPCQNQGAALAKGEAVAALQQAGVDPPQTDLFAVDQRGEITISWSAASNPWSLPGITTGPGIFPSGAALAAARNAQLSYSQTDVFAVDVWGNLDVSWVNGSSAWLAPVGITPNFPPGAHLAATQQAGLNQTDVVGIDNNGALSVTWTGSMAWQHQEETAQHLFPPGAPLVATPNAGTSYAQTVVWTVDNWGNLAVSWVDGGGTWAGPAGVAPGFPERAYIAASQQFGLAQQDVFAVDNKGALTVAWTTPTGWKTQEVTAEGFFPAGAPVAASQQFGENQTDVFVVDNQGRLNVIWAFEGGTWQGPVAISSVGMFPVGAQLSASAQFGAGQPQTDVFAIDASGNRTVTWAVGEGQWNGPQEIP